MIPESAKTELSFLKKQRDRATGENILIKVVAAFKNGQNKNELTEDKRKFYQLMVKFLVGELPTQEDIKDFQNLKLPKTPADMSSWLPEGTPAPYVWKVAQVAVQLPEWIKLNNPNKTDIALNNPSKIDAEWVVIEKDDNSTSRSSSRSRNNSAGSADGTIATDNISDERKALIWTLKIKKITNIMSFSNRDSNFTNAVVDAAYDDLIRELQDPASKISDIRIKGRLFNLNKTGYTIDHALNDESSQAALNEIQEKEEGKLIGNERNSIESISPSGSPSQKSILGGVPENFSGTISQENASAKENKNVVLLDPRERQNKISLIIMCANRISNVTDLLQLRLGIAQLRILKTQLARYDQPLTEDDIKNYDQRSGVVIVGDMADTYWEVCETIDQKYSEVEKALKIAADAEAAAKNAEAIMKEARGNDLVCSALKTEIENVILNIGADAHDGNATPELQPLRQLLVILQNQELDPAEKLHQCVTKIYGNDIKIDNTAIKNQFIATIGSILNKNPEAAVAVLTKEFKNYQQYMIDNDGVGTLKWDETERIIKILESDGPAANKLTDVNTRIMGEGKNTLSQARNPFAVFINIWAWVKRQFNSSACENKLSVSWDVASAQSKGAGVVKIAEGVLPKTLKF